MSISLEPRCHCTASGRISWPGLASVMDGRCRQSQGKARARALSRGLLEFNPLELELALGCPGDAGGFLITMQAD